MIIVSAGIQVLLPFRFHVLTNQLAADGTRNGYVRGLTTKIEEGSSIRGALISLITQEAGFKKYRIDTYHRSVPDGYKETIAEFDEIPYDMEFDVNTSIWEKVVEIRDLYPGWEAFFDVDGTFVFQGIPTCEFDEPVITASNWPRLFKESLVPLLSLKLQTSPTFMDKILNQIVIATNARSLEIHTR